MKKIIRMLVVTMLASTFVISASVAGMVMAQTRAFAPTVSIRLVEITGKIRDLHGLPVVAFKVSLRNWFGEDLASAVTDSNGVFDLRGVRPGRYHFNFRPLAENSRGETVIIDVPTHQLRMDMTVNRNPPAIALAHGAIPSLA